MSVTPTVPAPTANAAAAAAGAPPEDAPVRAATSKSKASKAPSASGKKGNLLETLARSVDPSGALPGLLRAFGVHGLTSVRRASIAGYATATSTATSTSSALSFLKDPKVPLEEKLMKLLAYLNGKWDKEIQDRLDKFAANENASTTTSKTKSKGILGSVVSAFSGALGAVGGAGKVLDFLKVPAVKAALKKLGGPVLAAAASAFGFPAAAPILLKYGPDVVNAALGVASAAGGSAAKTSQATSSGAALNDSDRQSLMLEIQHIRDKQKEMFGLVSNILRSTHDTRMSIVGNIR